MHTPKHSPPKWQLHLLHFLCHPDFQEDIEGDFLEHYMQRVEQGGRVRANWFFFFSVISLIKSNLIRPLEGYGRLNTYGMFKNYFKVAWRNLLKQRMYSLINVFGLTIGIVASLVILLYVQDELNYDRFHDKRDQIYRVIRKSAISGHDSYLIGVTSAPFAPHLQSDYPEQVKAATRIRIDKGLMTHQELAFQENKIAFADSNFFEVFSYRLLVGNPEKVLNDASGIVISKKMAEKYFGNEDPIGKKLTIDHIFKYEVTGIMDELSGNSHLDFDFVASLASMRMFGSFDNWWNNFLYTYVVIPDAKKATYLQSQLQEFMDKYFGEDFARTKTRMALKLQPLSEIYFQNEVRFDDVLHGDRQVVYLFIAIGILIIALAGINFMNLSTAKSTLRAKEVGIRKSLGGNRKGLIIQFLGESILLVSISAILSLVILSVLLNTINSSFQLTLEINFSNPSFIGSILAMIFIISFLSGFYPAFLLSSFNTIEVVKGKVKSGNSQSVLRKSLVVLQFCISIFMLVCTLVMGSQMEFLKNKNLGFDKTNTLVVRTNNQEVYRNRLQFKELLEQNANVISVSAMTGVPGGFHDATTVHIRNREEGLKMRTVFTDHDYVNTLGIQLKSGRAFSKMYSTDSREAVLINEEAAKQLGWSNEEAIGKEMNLVSFDSTWKTVVGVVSNFNFVSLKSEIEPIIISFSERSGVFAIRLNAQNLPTSIASVEEAWKQVGPNFPFQYEFLDEKFYGQYQKETLQSKIFFLFSGISILIACLGIFGLAAFMATNRTKEIGMRKVLGASISKITLLISKDFIVLVLLANLIAVPTSYFLANEWLSNFAYRIPITLWMFVLASVLTLFIALLSVSSQALKAALGNPVKALRRE